MVILRDGRDVLYQWDLGVKAVVRPAGAVDELHFVHSHHSDMAWVVDVSRHGVAPVPNLCLQEPGKLYAYESINGKRTGTYSVFTVRPRAKPSDYVYTEVEIKRYELLEQRIDDLEMKFNEFEQKDLIGVSNAEIDEMMEM